MAWSRRHLLSRKSLLDTINSQPSKPKDRTEAKRPAAHTYGINKEVNEEPIDNDKSQEDTEAAPLIALVDVEHLHVLRARAVRAILAVRRGVRVKQVTDAGDVRDEVSGVLGAGLAWGRVEMRGFGGGTLDVHGRECG